MARTTSSSTGSPIPAACDRTSEACSAWRRSGGMETVARAPKPVEMPYFGLTLGEPFDDRSSVGHAPDGGVGQLDVGAVPGDGDDVGDRHARSVEMHRHEPTASHWCDKEYCRLTI